MTRTPRQNPPDEGDGVPDAVLVGEYVLGLLDGDAAGALEARMAREPHLRALHAEWEEGFAPLLGARDTVPPAALRDRIEARLFGAPARRRPGLLSGLLTGALAATATVVALSLAVPLAPSFAPTLGAEIAGTEAGGAIAVTASADPDAGLLRVAVAGAAPAPGRSFEVWAIEGDAAPVSLGLLGPDGTIEVRPDRPPLREGLVIAVSDEPAGGSPDPAPSGPVLAAGPLGAI